MAEWQNLDGQIIAILDGEEGKIRLHDGTEVDVIFVGSDAETWWFERYDDYGNLERNYDPPEVKAWRPAASEHPTLWPANEMGRHGGERRRKRSGTDT